ncbi:MAG: MFS transporter [Acidimicrobiia bacterium]
MNISSALLAPARRFSVRDRRILTLMALAQFIISYSGSLISTTLPFARKALVITEGDMGQIFAITRVVSLVAIAFALYGDRHGRRGPFLLAFLIIPITSLATAVFPGVVLFTASQSVARVGVVAASAMAVVFLAEELTPGLRGYGIGVWAMAGAMGGGTSLLLLPLADRGLNGWRFLFALSAVGIFVFPLLARFLRESQAFSEPEYHIPLSAVFGEGHGQYLWTMGALAFFLAAFAAPATDFALERIIEDLEWSTGSAVALVIAASGLGTLGLLVGGRLADTLGRRPTEMIALLTGLGGGLLFYFGESGPLLAAGLFLGTLGATTLTPAFGAHRAELFPTRLRATAGGWVTNAAILGSVAGFAASGELIDRIGLSSTIAVLGIGVLVSLVMVLPLPETKGRDLTKPFASTKHPGQQPVPPSGL